MKVFNNASLFFYDLSSTCAYVLTLEIKIHFYQDTVSLFKNLEGMIVLFKMICTEINLLCVFNINNL